MLTKIQIETMLRLQDDMNSKIDPDWKNLGWDFPLAIMMEATEAIDHHGWKWWKKQTPDMPQLQMELVDIWHFMIAELIANPTTIDNVTLIKETEEHVASHLADNPIKEGQLLEVLRDLASGAGQGQLLGGAFFMALAASGMTTEDLYKQYVGKNILNRFRQDHGYKDGTYVKIWDGREDNEHLTELLETVNLDSDDLYAELYEQLSNTYSDVLNNITATA